MTCWFNGESKIAACICVGAKTVQREQPVGSAGKTLGKRSMTGIFCNRWWVVFASLCGLVVSPGPISIFSFGVFLKPVTEELGIARGVFSSALLINGVAVAVSSAVVGWLIDRYGVRRVMIPGILLFAVVVACYGLMQSSPLILVFVIFAFTGFFGGVQTPVPYAATVAKWFDRNRGLALGIATAGIGLGAAVIPLLASHLIGQFGWRVAYVGLALAILVLAGIPVALFLREPPSLAAAARRPSAMDFAENLPGMKVTTALRSWHFWALTIAFFLSILAITGTLTHVVALLTDRGVPQSVAVGALSSSGLALIISRVFSGWCLDRFWGPYVAVIFFMMPLVGIMLLGSGAEGFVPLLGAILCGMGAGAEVDLMAFFVSRYFGLRAYGKIYGLMFSFFAIGVGLGPALSGQAFDRFHSYGPIFTIYEIVLAITCVLFLRLGPYPYPAPERADASGAQQDSVARTHEGRI
jgi:MFS family permease